MKILIFSTHVCLVDREGGVICSIPREDLDAYGIFIKRSRSWPNAQ